MLPLSTVLAVYAILTQQDIGKLIMAGILPGLLAIVNGMGQSQNGDASTFGFQRLDRYLPMKFAT